MSNKIYWQGTSKIELSSAKRVLQEFKDMDNKSNGLEPCGLSFSELMTELKS